ncbi:MAG: hypothetical protein LUC25_01375 [Ruminococcus sp.]|nr:hypothetical protein [Ruminococcus sp.]
MKLKKILFSIICAALLVGSTIACFASASTGTDASIQSTKSYTYTATYNGATLKAMGQPGSPASISQIYVASTDDNEYYGEVYISRAIRGKVIEDTDTGVVSFGNGLAASVAQDSSNTGTYVHQIYLHAGSPVSSPIIKTIDKTISF